MTDNNKTEEILTNVPEKIYLQITDRDDLIEGDNFIDFEAREICWSANRVFDQDIEYILKSKSDSLLQSEREKGNIKNCKHKETPEIFERFQCNDCGELFIDKPNQ